MLLVIVLTLVAVMTFIFIARAVFTSSVTSEVLRSSLGIQCQTLAESAAEEALVRLRESVNDPAHAIYPQFRREVYAEQNGDFAVDLELPVFDQMRSKNENLRSFYLAERGATVAFQRQFSSMPYERFGLLKVGTRVSTDLRFADTVTRRVELGIEFKVNLLSLPRPFDQTCVYIHDADGILRPAQQRMEDALSEIERRRSEHQELTDRVESQKDSLPFDGTGMHSRYVGVRIPPREFWEAKAPPIDAPAAVYGLGRNDAGIELAELQIGESASQAHEALRQTEEACAQARTRLEGDFLNEERHNDYLEKQRIMLGAYSQLLGLMERFRATFQVYDGEKYAVLAPFGYKLGREDWRRKVTFDLDRDPEGRTPQQVFDGLLKENPRLYGVFYTSKPGAVLQLKGRSVPGRVVLVAEETALEVGDFNGAAGDTDLFTIVSFGSMRLSGKVHAAVMALGGCSMEPGTEIRGSLVLDRVASLADVAGRVKYERKYYSGRTTTDDTSGAFSDYYFVSLASRPVYKSVERR